MAEKVEVEDDLISEKVGSIKANKTKNLVGKKKNDKKRVSMSDFKTANIEVSDPEFNRRRSRSAPISLEAACVATELKRLSDSLHTMYSSFKKKSRRQNDSHAIGESTSKRESFHFDYDKYPDTGLETNLVHKTHSTSL